MACGAAKNRLPFTKSTECRSAGNRAKRLAACARAVTAPGMAVIGSDMFAHMPLIMIDKMLRSF